MSTRTKQEKAYELVTGYGWEFSHHEGSVIVVARYEHVGDARFLLESGQITPEGVFTIRPKGTD